ncbi:TetR/AcrR family transcriptional regulator [Microbacterium sp. 4R-513]|uniref:TetR/AcrR family transcriptional regulator n=1 Tax=Microbacterium sp. 4R-513 TaxID=2567934 RepID=UPI001F494D98|nr:TetR/AcrR family transcriptional regulator [Microbacterium sp. 4R-513]
MDTVKRAYNSTSRARQAQENRDRISRAAHDLFVERGYGNTTVIDVAKAADVSPETIYKSFGSKAELLRSAWFVMFRGDGQDETLYDRPETQAVLQLPDLASRIEGFARLTAARSRRSAPLLRAIEGAAASEAGARDMLTTWHARLIDVAARFARSAAETGQLAIPEDECRDIMFAMLDGHLWQRLVVERGWTDERYADWLAAQWQHQFIAASERVPGS